VVIPGGHGPNAIGTSALAPSGATAGTGVDAAVRLLGLVETGLFHCGPDGRVRFANASLTVLAGDMTGAETNAGWLTPVNSTDALWTLVRATDRVTLPAWLMRADGSRLRVDVTAQALRSEDGEIIGFDGLVRPIDDAESRPASSRAAAEDGVEARAARAEERRAIARRLHDNLGQTLVVMKMEIDRLVETPDEDEPLHVREPRAMRALKGWTDEAIRLVRGLCFELRAVDEPPLEVSAIVEPLLRDLARPRQLKTRIAAAGGPVRLDPRRALLVADVCREAITNVIRHAAATEILVRVVRRGPDCALSISDNGAGFAPGSLDRPDAFGVLGMRERAQALGGTFEIVRRDGRTVVSLTLPVASPGAAASRASHHD
jgi:signal transduction histidine kinase